MSVYNLATSVCNVYSVTMLRDKYGTYYEDYDLKYENIPIRTKSS